MTLGFKPDNFLGFFFIICVPRYHQDSFQYLLATVQHLFETDHQLTFMNFALTALISVLLPDLPSLTLTPAIAQIGSTPGILALHLIFLAH